MSPRRMGGLGLEVGVFDLAAGTLAGRQAFADEISYPAPGSAGGGPYEWAAGALVACGW